MPVTRYERSSQTGRTPSNARAVASSSPPVRSVALPGVMASTVDHGSIVSAPRASERARRGSGNSSGLGKAEASGTTSRDLAEEIAAGRFREDLYYRLNVVPVRIPALKERREDIPDLVTHFLARYAADRRIPSPEVSEEALAALQANDWPGNVRQMRNVLRTLVALCEDNRIEFSDLPAIVKAGADSMGAGLAHERVKDVDPAGATAGQARSHRDPATLEHAERDALLTVLEAKHWHMTHVAEHLGISRNTLYRKLRKHGIARAG